MSECDMQRSIIPTVTWDPFPFLLVGLYLTPLPKLNPLFFADVFLFQSHKELGFCLNSEGFVKCQLLPGIKHYPPPNLNLIINFLITVFNLFLIKVRYIKPTFSFLYCPSFSFRPNQTKHCCVKNSRKKRKKTHFPFLLSLS